MQVRFLLGTPTTNSTAFLKPTCGTREARPNGFRLNFAQNPKGNSPKMNPNPARWRALIFRRGGGSSQRFLWHRPFWQKGLNQKQFCLYSVRLLTSFGKVRANHSACVKDCRFLLRATSSRTTVFLFANDNLLGQLFGRDSHSEVALTFETKKKSFLVSLSHKQSKTGRIFRGLAEQDDSVPPPSLWAKKLFELLMITGDLILLDEYKVLHTSRFCFSWCSDSKHIREHYHFSVSSPCIRQLSSFRTRRRK